MARHFSSKDARRLKLAHERIINQHCAIQESEQKLQAEIKKAANVLVAEEARKMLESIPIEAVNRDKRGIKIKTLRDHGYRTIADIGAASAYEIASISGVGSYSAGIIREVTDQIYRETLKSTKIRISTDNKTESTTKLVSTISRYIRMQPLIDMSRQIMREKGNTITQAITKLHIGTNGIRWFFSSNTAKQEFEKAYRFLSETLLSEYSRETDDLLQKVSDVWNLPAEESWIEFQKNSIPFFHILEELSPGSLGTDDSMYGLPEYLAKDVQNEVFHPEGLKCELRRYQEWGVRYILHQKRVLLGDEMGLGKTIQAIAAMVSLRNTGATHFIVVCPASVLTNWCREISKHSNLKYTLVHRNGRNPSLESWIKEGGVAITNYETTKYFMLEKGFHLAMVVVDEAHYIKNPKAQRTINVANIAARAEYLLFMTGTAFENRVGEMINLIQILQPTVANQVRGLEALAEAPLFKEKVTPVYYRRKRTDVLTELPEKVESQEWCTMRPYENKKYEESILYGTFNDIRRVSWNTGDLSNSSKANRMLEIIHDAETEDRKVIVFSYFLDTLSSIAAYLGNRCLPPIKGELPPNKRQEIIDRFENAPAGTVLAAQILAGGTGLNIQTASVVIICEPQFKPSIENQAISRAYRMGQTRNVLVYRLLCENTIDEKIIELLENKQIHFDAFADQSEAALQSAELDNKAFGIIIQSERKRIKDQNPEAGQLTKSEIMQLSSIAEMEPAKLFAKQHVAFEKDEKKEKDQWNDPSKQENEQMRVSAIVRARIEEAKHEKLIYQQELAEREELRKGYYDILGLMWQQEKPAKDSFGRRWVRCKVCNRISLEEEFVSYGGNNHVNLGVCKACAEKVNGHIR